MSSSDSEDDCYTNVALKLQKMKNHYVEDKFETNNLLNDSNEVQNIVKTVSNTSSIDLDESLGLKENSSTNSSQQKTTQNPQLNTVVAQEDVQTSNQRVTRASRRKAASSTLADSEPVPKKTRKRVGKNAITNSDTAETSIATPSTSNISNIPTPNPVAMNPPVSRQNRGRRKGQGRTPRRSCTNRNLQNLVQALSSMIPTYSVGNTYDYPDQCETQQLFCNKPKPASDVLIIEDQDPLDENEELSVKVYWQNSEFFKFNLRRFQKLTQIFEYFAKKENVSHSNLLFMFNDGILTENDTPESIQYNIGKFIDGGIVNKNISQLTKKNYEEKIVNGLKIKFQRQGSKKPFETVVGANDKLSLAMLMCAEHFEIQLDKLKFEFDGDTILGSNTANDLEFEGGECIDVKVIS